MGVIDILDAALEQVSFVPMTQEEEACEAKEAGRSSRVHDTLVRAAVREMNTLLDLQERWSRRNP